MLHLWLAATPALRVPPPVMQQARVGEITPVGRAPGWHKTGGRFNGGVVSTNALQEETRDAEPSVGGYVAPHTAPYSEAPSAESSPQVYSKWLATRTDGGAAQEKALAERAVAERSAAGLAARKAEERAAADQAAADRATALKASSERASAERAAKAMADQAEANRAAADRVAAGRAAADRFAAQRAAKAAEEQAMAEQAVLHRETTGRAAAAAWCRGRLP